MFVAPINVKVCIDEVTNEVVWFQAGQIRVAVPKYFSPALGQLAISLSAFLLSASDFDAVKGCSFPRRYA